jgi:hypothetical protein
LSDHHHDTVLRTKRREGRFSFGSGNNENNNTVGVEPVHQKPVGNGRDNLSGAIRPHLPAGIWDSLSKTAKILQMKD